MHMSAAFIKRPVMTTLLMAAFVLAGIYGYFSLPVSELPNVDFPTIEVKAGLPGADAETMASSVATPLEKQFSLIAGLDSMTSQSGQGTDPHHAAVPSRPQHRCRVPGRAGGGLGGHAGTAARHALAAFAAQDRIRPKVRSFFSTSARRRCRFASSISMSKTC